MKYCIIKKKRERERRRREREKNELFLLLVGRVSCECLFRKVASSFLFFFNKTSFIEIKPIEDFHSNE